MEDHETYARIQSILERSSAEFWEPVAKRELHWFHDTLSAWFSLSDGQWTRERARFGSRPPMLRPKLHQFYREIMSEI